MTSHTESVLKYYRKAESRLGYKLLLDGIRHFGWYPNDGSTGKWHFAAAIRSMELLLGRRLALEPGQLILDAGCGEGHVARTLAEEFGVSVVGIDLVPESIDIANDVRESTGTYNTEFLVGDYHKLQFEDNKFDRLYTMETFVHAAEPRVVLSEFLRVVKSGSLVVMLEYSSTPRAELAPDAYASLKKVCDLAAMPAWLELTHGRMEELATEAGFEVVSSENITNNMLPMLDSFAAIARVPFWLVGLMSKKDRAVNAMSAVEMSKHKDAWRYNVYVFRKPAERATL